MPGSISGANLAGDHINLGLQIQMRFHLRHPTKLSIGAGDEPQAISWPNRGTRRVSISIRSRRFDIRTAGADLQQQVSEDDLAQGR
jgi:hypothetical protein